MNMKKAIAATVCAGMVVVGSVAGTMAYFTDTHEVENSFTVGQVGISLDEADVTEYGVVIEDAARVEGNTYKLIPNHQYVKDPTVHIDANSEESYLFVKVENGLSAYEDSTATIASQMTDWTEIDTTNHVYAYKETVKGGDADVVVFNNFKIANDADVAALVAQDGTVSAKIKVTAYAVQKDGFATAEVAWATTFGADDEDDDTEANA